MSQSAGRLWEVATCGARWRAKVKGVRWPPVPPQRRRIDRGVKKVPVRLAAHRENWLLAVFHLRRRGDPEGRSSINAAVFISCFTQSSRCWCVWWWGGALPLNINFNVLLFARLLLFVFIFSVPLNDANLQTSVITRRDCPPAPRHEISLSPARRHRPKLNFSRDCASDSSGSIGLEKKKLFTTNVSPALGARGAPARTYAFYYFFPLLLLIFPYTLIKPRATVFALPACRLPLQLFSFFFLGGGGLRARRRRRASAIITHSLSAEPDFAPACNIPALPRRLRRGGVAL